MNFRDLAAPFPPDAIHWRAQTLTQDGTKALALAYLDARDVMDRLDAICGPEGWEDSYVETPRGRVICTLSIKNEAGAWVSKSDGAGDTAVEGEKGGISDAFKRAAVKWGIGRYLYDLDSVWAPCDFKEWQGKKQWKGWKPDAQRAFATALAKVSGGSASKPQTTPEPEAPALITDRQREDLIALFERQRVDVGAFLQMTGLRDLRDLHAASFDRAKAWIMDQSQKKEAA